MKLFILLVFLLSSNPVNALESRVCLDWEKVIKKGIKLPNPLAASESLNSVRSGLSNCITYLSSESALYKGERKNGKMNGMGSLTFPNGSQYVGNFKDDNMNGQGTYTFSDGTQYIGQWIDGKLNGLGTYSYTDGTRYKGDWSNGRFNGQGTIIYASGDKYSGNFINGALTGQGIYLFSNGTQLQGLFYNGKYVPSICDRAGLPEGSPENKQCILMYMNKIIN